MLTYTRYAQRIQVTNEVHGVPVQLFYISNQAVCTFIIFSYAAIWEVDLGQ